MICRHPVKALTLILPLLLLFSLHPSADAARPEDEPAKGSVPARACVVLSGGGTEPDEPVPVDVGILYIGLDYDQNAREEAGFVNASGLGFQFGTFDEDRVFQPFAELPMPELTVRLGQSWHVLLDEEYASPADAAAAAENFGGVIIELDGASRIIIGSYDNHWDAETSIRYYALPGTARQISGYRVYDAGGHLRGLYSEVEELAIRAVSDGEAHTRYRGEEYTGSFLLRRWENDRLTVINAVELENYVKGVIPYEMSPSWPVEALKAQAVCARTYAVYHLNAYAEDYGFDLTDDTESQVYRGLNGADAVTDAAVDATRGQFIRYRGELCEIYYFSSDGGATEDGAKIFGSEQPYLAGKTDPFEQAVDFAVMRWERRFSGEEIAGRLRDKGYEIGTVVAVEPSYSELGNVTGMCYTDRNGVSLVMQGRDSYSPLALDSARFSVTAEKDGFVFRGVGWGHNCGMSQWGAYAMADSYGLSADDIIRFYFTGASIG